MKKPKDTLLFKWTKAHGSLGDLGPGYPVDHFAGHPTKLFKLLTKLGISAITLSDFDKRYSGKKIVGYLLAISASAFVLYSAIMHWLYG